MENKYIRRIKNSIKKRGLWNTLLFIMDDFLFEYKYKIDVSKIIALKDLKIQPEKVETGTDYQGVNARNFKKVMKKVPIDPYS